MSSEIKNINYGWKIGIFSYKFIFKNKKLLLFPILSALILGLLIGLFIAGFDPNSQAAPGGVIKFFILYFSAISSVIFFNVATISVANDYLEDAASISLLSGIKVACSKLDQIILWAMFMGSVGLLLNILEAIERKIYFPIVSLFFEMAWGVAIYFVVPIICFTWAKGPFTLIEESMGTVRKCWERKQVSRIFGFSALMFLSWLPIVLLLYIAHYLPKGNGQLSLYYICGACGAILIALNWVVKAVLQTIIYRFAEYGFVAPGLDRSWLENVAVIKTE